MAAAANTKVSSFPMVSQDPTDPLFVQDPYSAYRKWRALGEFVYWSEQHMPVATTHEAVRAILTNKSMGREVPESNKPEIRAGLEPFFDLEANSMLELEPQRHTRLRALVLRAFTKRRILHLAPAISVIADDLISDFPTGAFDLLDAYAQRLPVIVIARLLGVPEETTPQLLDWSNAMVAMYQSRKTPAIENAAAKAAAEFTTFMRDHIEARRSTPADDLITHLIAAEEEGDKLTTDEMISTCILLLNAGHEATVHSIGNAVYHLSNHEDVPHVLAPANIERTVEECLRFDPPLHLFTRHVYDDTSVRGQQFKAGQEVGCLLGSACHDDAIWPDGYVFNPLRDERPHMAFGAGIHFCVGAPLARLEMQIALPILFSRCPNLKVVEPPTVANLYHFRGLERLMVEV